MGSRMTEQSHASIASALEGYLSSLAEMEPVVEGSRLSIPNYERHFGELKGWGEAVQKAVSRSREYRVVGRAVGEELEEYRRLLAGGDRTRTKRYLSAFVGSRAQLAHRALNQAEQLLSGVPIPVGGFPGAASLESLVNVYFRNARLRKWFGVGTIGSIGAASLLIGAATLFNVSRNA